MTKIAGIRRGNQYSPNHIGNDAAIFNLVIEQLSKAGYQVTEYSELEFLDSEIDANVIFNMARDTRSIQKLQQLEDEGKLVINSGYGIENCTREKMTRLLVANEIPHPRSIIVSTKSPEIDFDKIHSTYWIKRGDFHAIHREDVSYARNKEEAGYILSEYAIRGIETAVINEHLEGDLIKFYGVTGSDFFYWFYPDENSHSKFGWEIINGKACGLKFDLPYLKMICNLASKVLNIHIYGGDAVIDKDGNIRIIDFNDWPSFAPCRNEAAPAISQCICNKIKEKEEVLLQQTKSL